MTVGESLKKLKVAVKGGGSIVSHPPVFSPDSKNVYIVQKNTVLIFNTITGRCNGKFSTPNAAPIANVVHLLDPPDHLLILTSSGTLIEIESANLQVISTREVNLKPKNWIPILSVLNFVWPSGGSINATHFFFLGYPQDATLPVLYSVENSERLSMQHLCKEIVPNVHSIAAGVNGRFVAAIQADSLFVKDMTVKGCRWHKAGSRKFTCVAVHPREWICATGDDSGRILIWTNSLENHVGVAKTVFHWHTLPVADLCFSTDGSQMYSGGGECTLVKWDVHESDNKRTLPRLGLPIRHVRGSPGNDLLAIAHADNCIHLVNSFNVVVSTIQNITQCYIPDSIEDININETSLGGSRVFQAGLHIDPNNQSLITNGRPGHLQCYSFREDKHLYSLDITQQNYITAERNKPIPNADINHVSFSKNGVWLATSESRIDDQKYTELRLKFWKFDKEKQTFVLNTSIDWPHEGGIKSLKIQPISEEDPTFIAASSGFDSKFKTWGIVHDPSIHGKSEWWNCEDIGSYRDLPSGPLSFSQDGSLLAVAFGRILTVWASSQHKLKLSLCHSKLQENITLLEFGSHISSHLIMTCTSQNITTWDVITSSLLWVVPFQAENIAIDPSNNLAAAFSSKHHLILFSLDHSEPLAVHKNVSSTRVGSSIFVPYSSPSGEEKLKSTLFFINSSQELCALLPPVEDVDEDIIRIQSEGGTSLLTPFAQLIAEKTVFQTHHQVQNAALGRIGVPGYQILRDIMDQSPYAMPSMTYYCSQLLQALNVRRTPSDNLEDVEKAIKASFAKQKPKRFKGSRFERQEPPTDEEDEVSLPNLDLLNFKKTLNQKSTFRVELENVANEDTTWIDTIFKRD